jgi:two-component system LytT family response regulator
MKRIKAIIVDDEKDARDVLKTLIGISQLPYDIVAECSSLMDAVAEIKLQQPDVVFLDIQMPKYAGYEIVQFFDKIEFEIVFVTAFDKYALQAFELCAIDYLVKPINRSRLNITLERVMSLSKSKQEVKEYSVLMESINNRSNQKLIIPEKSGNRIIPLSEICCIQGSGSYSIIYLSNKKKITVSKQLLYFQEKLPSDSTFFRSQKSWIINLNMVSKYNLNKGDIIFNNDLVAKVSPSKTDEFLEQFSMIQS